MAGVGLVVRMTWHNTHPIDLVEDAFFDQCCAECKGDPTYIVRAGVCLPDQPSHASHAAIRNKTAQRDDEGGASKVAARLEHRRHDEVKAALARVECAHERFTILVISRDILAVPLVWRHRKVLTMRAELIVHKEGCHRRKIGGLRPKATHNVPLRVHLLHMLQLLFVDLKQAGPCRLIRECLL
eukprot:scaffold1053_cov107-Isochrysis_galbana.AAC.18